MGDWVELYPKSITLAPLEEKEVKIYVEAPENTPNGEYKTHLVIKEIETPEQIKQKSKLKILTLLRLELRGYVGDLEPKLEDDLKIENRIIKGKIKNSGNRKIIFEIFIKFSGNKKEKYIKKIQLEKNEEIEVKEKISGEDLIKKIIIKQNGKVFNEINIS